jgi:putative ABC transport system ATP-binding protein/lipoprotein-releasing system ATP-binding protein
VSAFVDIRGVSKAFTTGRNKITAVDDVSASIAPGSMVAVVGPSGSGKSTLLHLIGAIERADAGSIHVDQCDITSMPQRRLHEYRRSVGFVFQRYHLLPTITALDNVLAPLAPYRVDFDKVARARELLDLVGLSGREHALPGELSGGQQQRVAIARALVARPKLLLADEPTGSLDSRTGEQILNLLAQVRREIDGITMIIATHEHQVAARCDRLIRLRDGRVVEDNSITSTRH